ncbi:MAG: aldo/keto reductase [bacterium]|nr:aldo/keto reductase [bacterium]
MERVTLGRTGIEVSAIGVGTWAHGGPRQVGSHQVGWSGHDEKQARDALIEAFESGIDHFDTADVYGDGQSERIIGSLWERIPRDRVFLASKVGWDPGPYGHFYHPDLVAARLERSLDLLRTDYLDLYYLHHCDFGPEDSRLPPVLEVLDRARQAGKFRFLGLSDWSSDKVLRVGAKVEPDVVQVYRNVIDDQYRRSGLETWVAEQNLGAVFFSALKHGVLLGKYREPISFEAGDMRNEIAEFQDLEALERFASCRRAVERRFARHPEPVLHALTGALLGTGRAAGNQCVLVGMRNREQARAAARLGTALSPAEADWVQTLYRGESAAS